MSAIAADMGGSKETLWRYFSSKERLFEFALDEASSSFGRAIQVALDLSDDSSDALVGVAEKFVQRFTSEEGMALQRLVVGEAERFPAVGRYWVDQVQMEARTAIAGRMREWLTEEEAVEAAGMLLDLCSGGYYQRVLLRIDPPDMSSARAHAVSAVENLSRCYPGLRGRCVGAGRA